METDIFYCGSSKSSRCFIGSQSSEANSVSSGNGTACNQRSSNRPNESSEEKFSIGSVASMDKRKSGDAVPNNSKGDVENQKPFQLTDVQAMLLERGLRKKVTQWEGQWIKEFGQILSTSDLFKEAIAALSEEVEVSTLDLQQCLTRSSSVLKTVESSRTRVDFLVATMGHIDDTMNDADEKIKAVQIMEDACLELEATAFRLHQGVTESSADLLKTYKMGHLRKRSRLQRSATTQESDPWIPTVLNKVHAYHRLIELNGGTRPKSTSEKNVVDFFANTKSRFKASVVNDLMKQHENQPPPDTEMLDSLPPPDVD